MKTSHEQTSEKHEGVAQARAGGELEGTGSQEPLEVGASLEPDDVCGVRERSRVAHGFPFAVCLPEFIKLCSPNA